MPPSNALSLSNRVRVENNTFSVDMQHTIRIVSNQQTLLCQYLIYLRPSYVHINKEILLANVIRTYLNKLEQCYS